MGPTEVCGRSKIGTPYYWFLEFTRIHHDNIVASATGCEAGRVIDARLAGPGSTRPRLENLGTF